MAKVTGIGGVFIRSTKDQQRLTDWYAKNLGLQPEDWGGAILKWPDDKAEDHGLTVWHTAEPTSDWFAPSTAPFMINYRVDDMNGIIERLHANGVKLFKGPEYAENGTFAWVIDPDDNKVELWEPKNWDEKNKR